MQEKDREFVLSTFRMLGQTIAEKMEEKSSEMTPTEIVANGKFYPLFNAEKQYLNYKAGYICVSPTGNLVRLLQPYDSTIYTDPPEKMESQWGFVWTTDPQYAKPFVESATSPYNNGDCCIYNGFVWRSNMDYNTWPPGTEGIDWENLGPAPTN